MKCGIDFGTTNSAAAIVGASGLDGEDNVRLVPLESCHITIPTAMYFPDNCSQTHFGRDAIDIYTARGEGRLMRSIKRILGTDLMQKITMVGNMPVSYFKVILEFICHIKNKIDISAGADVDSVVMGRPVHFQGNDADCDMRAEKELREIALSAGFKNLAFQFEPIAAAFAHEQKIIAEKLAIVIDIGGGTSDFTIVRLSPDRKNAPDRRQDILANMGVRIGGNDFDKSLSIKSFMPELGMGSEITSAGKHLMIPTSPYFALSTWNEINDLYSYQYMNRIDEYFRASNSPELVGRFVQIVRKNLGHKNLGYIENAKIQLSAAPAVEVTLDFLSNSPSFCVTRQNFYDAIERDVLKLGNAMHECLMVAGVSADDIDLVILTGGSTEIPRINNMARSYFPAAEFSVDDKLSSVGLGLAYDARRRFGALS